MAVSLNDKQVVREIGILHEMECSPSASENVPNLLVAERHVETHLGPKRKVDIYLVNLLGLYFQRDLSKNFGSRWGMSAYLLLRGLLYQFVKLNIVGISSVLTSMGLW
jgi:hypothetical protein